MEIKKEIIRIIEEGNVRYEKYLVTINGVEFETFVLLDSGKVQYKNTAAKTVDALVKSSWEIYN